jgi:RHS repeat-associated protein
MLKLRKFFIIALSILTILPWQLSTLIPEAKAATPAGASTEIQPPKSGEIELVDKRTETSKTYLESTGRKKVVSYASPIHYKSSDGSWQDINSNLSDSVDGSLKAVASDYQNVSNNFNLKVSKNIKDKLFSFDKNGGSIQFALPQVATSQSLTNLNLLGSDLFGITSTKSSNKVTYQNVYPNTDIILYSVSDGVKEDIVLNKYTGQSAFTFNLNISNVHFQKMADGSYKFYKNGTNEFLFMMPRFYMWDSKGGKDSAENNLSYALTSTITAKGTYYEVKIQADQKWLSASSRVYPVTIDPSVTTMNGNEDTYVQSSYADTQAWDQRTMYVGTGQTKGIMRGLVTFPTPDLHNARIISSHFDVYQYGNCSGSAQTSDVNIWGVSSFDPTNVTWNSQPHYSGPFTGGNNANLDTWLSFDTTAMARYWYYANDSAVAAGGVALVSGAEGTWGFRTLATQNNPDIGSWASPHLTIEYNDYNAQYYPNNSNTNFIANSVNYIPVTVYNTGRNTWNQGSVKLSYHLINNATGETIFYDGLRTELPKNVGPGGDSFSVLAQVKAPPIAGSYTVRWDMIQEGVTWFKDQDVPTADTTISVTPPSFSSMNHLGSEDYYTKAGPVDLATGNLAYSSTDMSIPSNTGLLSVSRSYNSSSLDQTFTADQDGFIRTWLVNGPYKSNDQSVRLTGSFIPNENQIMPSNGSTSDSNLWLPYNSGSGILDYNVALDNLGAQEAGSATNVAAYSSVYVYSPVSRPIKLKVGSDDGVRVWLNGSLVLSNDVYRGITIDNDVVASSLNQGWNRLLVKVSQGVGGWSQSVRIEDISDQLLPDLKYTLNDPEVFSRSSLLQKGWSLSFDQRIFATDPNNIYVQDGTGSVNIYSLNSDGSYKRPAGIDIDLTKNSDGSFSLLAKTGVKTVFNTAGRPQKTADLNGNQLLYTYDASGLCTKIADEGRSINLGYSSSGILYSLTDNLGNVINYRHLPITEEFTDVMFPDNTFYSYKMTDGKLTSFSDQKNNITQIKYVDGKVSEIVDPLTNSTKFSYGDHVTTVTDPLSHNSTVEFDKANLLIFYTDAKGYKENYSYDSDFNLVSKIPVIPENDQFYFRWSYSYDQNQNLLSETDPLNQVVTYQYSGNDLVKAVDQAGAVTTYQYSADGKRRLLKTTDAKNFTTTYKYDARGRALSVTSPKGEVTSYTYNANGDLTSTKTPKGEVSRLVYDAIGRKIRSVSPSGLVTSYKYNKLSKLTNIIDPSGYITVYQYDANGNQIRTTDPKGLFTVYGYDALNRLISVKDAGNATIKYAYDGLGNKTKVTDAFGKSTQYIYDELNQLVSKIDPVGNKTNIVYDRNGNATSVQDVNGVASTMQYDKDGQATSIQTPDATTNMSYSQSGNLTAVSSTANNENSSIVYDNNSNIISVSSNITGTNSSTYDQNNNLVAANTSTNSTSLSYDPNGQVDAVSSTVNGTNQSLGTTQMSRDINGKLTLVTKPNGDTTSYLYDSSFRTTSAVNKNKDSLIISSYSYIYDANSNPISMTDNSGKIIHYGYDNRNQLLVDDLHKYAYNLMGNRTSMTTSGGSVSYTYETGDSNRLSTVTDPAGAMTTYQYDNAGNVIKKTAPTGVTSYTYDSDNYFIKAVLPDGSSVEYLYDKIAGHRTERIETKADATKVITKFVYSGDLLTAETDDAGKLQKTYTWDENENLFSISLADSQGNLTTYYYLKNAKGDVVGLSNQNGQKVVDYKYDSYGNLIGSTVAETAPAGLDKQNPRLYSSYWFDGSLGLYFMKVRMYSPEIGRFLSPDPAPNVETALDLNPYLYCNNNPVMRIDPSGKGWFSNAVNWASDHKAFLIGAAVGVGVAVAIIATGGLAAIPLAIGASIVAGAVAGGITGGVEYTVNNWGHMSAGGLARSIGRGAVSGAIGGGAGGAAVSALAAAAAGAAAAYASIVATGTTIENLSTKIDASAWADGGQNSVSPNVVDVANRIAANNNQALEGFESHVYKNVTAPYLPDDTSYIMHDVNPFVDKAFRGLERLVIGDNGSMYYSSEHYSNWIKLK